MLLGVKYILKGGCDPKEQTFSTAFISAFEMHDGFEFEMDFPKYCIFL